MKKYNNGVMKFGKSYKDNKLRPIEKNELPVIESKKDELHEIQLTDIYKKNEQIVQKEDIIDKPKLSNTFADSVRLILIQKKHGW